MQTKFSSSSEPLPAARTLLEEPLLAAGIYHTYSLPLNTAGQSAQSQRRGPSAGPGGRQLFPVPLTAAATTAAVTSAAPQSTVVSVTHTDLLVATVLVTEVPVAVLPRATHYRYTETRTEDNKHKVYYCCRKCGQPSTADTSRSQTR